MLTRHVELALVLEAVPLGRQTLYNYHNRGRLPWLSRAPAGIGGKSRLLVDWPQACAWFTPRGVDLAAVAAVRLPHDVCHLLGIGVEIRSTK